ncbi:MAG: hypothetical protein J6C51_05770, partial [Clostridia bacterium]|nr:hypothetical protein [Clostridia bacterium]
DNEATNGAGIYIGGTTLSPASFAVSDESAGTVELCDNTAAGSGAGVCIKDGEFTLSSNKITLQRNAAKNGGAVAVLSGNFTMSDGEVGAEGNGNTAENGGAVYVSGGKAEISGGEVHYNTAEVNGGGIAVENGKIVMSGGEVSYNKANTGSGGGMYVASTTSEEVSVIVFSGTLQNNKAEVSGGAVGMAGEAESVITVQIGLNQKHTFENDVLQEIIHDHDLKTYTHRSCPVIINNTAQESGGAFSITGGKKTNLNVYCLHEEGNKAVEDIDIHNTPLSNFLMVKGGVVIVSTSDSTPVYIGKEDEIKEDISGHGSTVIEGSIHVEAGQMELMGNMNNPRIEGTRTIDLKSDEDWYIDHRGSTEKVKISYHENFRNPDGTIDSTQTAFDLDSGSKHIVETSLYVHEGYIIRGWNISPDAQYGVTEGGWYTPGEEFTFYNAIHKPANMEGNTDYDNHVHYGDLTVYAIWQINGYFVNFDSGIPVNEEWDGEVEQMQCNYHTEYPAPENGFTWAGHKFLHWTYDGKTYAPGDKFKNLTAEDGKTVTMTAVWADCEHPHEKQTYTADGSTITRTCTVCSLSATAELRVQNATYDGSSHHAKVEYSNEDFFKPTEVTVSYEGTKINSVESVTAPDTCVNAGNYTATMTAGDDVSVTGSFTIAKADQPAPTSRPTYEAPENGSSILTVHELKEQAESGVSGAFAEYFVRHYDDGEVVDVEIVDADPNTAGLQYTLPSALKVYTVLARYAETENYNPSAFISADSTYPFWGKLSITIRAEEGINLLGGEFSGEEHELLLYVAPQEGYYKSGGDFVFTKKIKSGGAGFNVDTDLTVDKYDKAPYTHIIKAAKDADEPTGILITVSGVKKRPTLTAQAKEKQHFGEFEATNDVKISRDSAFTVLYTFIGYDTSDFDVPELRFYDNVHAEKTLPNKATVIMRDMSDGTYWYHKVEDTTTSSIPLNSFKKMGESATEYSAATGDLELQFVVDFSKSAGAEGSKIACALFAKKTSANAQIEDIDKAVEIGLADSGANMESIPLPAAGLDQKVKLNVSVGAPASKYDYRDLSIVLSVDQNTPLPIDAGVLVTIEDHKITYSRKASGEFIIPLGDFVAQTDKEIGLTLTSKLFPNETSVYMMTAALRLSNSNAEAAPKNGDILKDNIQLTFTNSGIETGIKIIETTDKRTYTRGERIVVRVETVPETLNPADYTVVVQLHQKFKDESGSGADGTFGNTALPPIVHEDGSYSFDLSNMVEGSYCVVAQLAESVTDYVVNEARYYFIVEEPEQ